MLVKVPYTYDVIGLRADDPETAIWERRPGAVVLSIEEFSEAEAVFPVLRVETAGSHTLPSGKVETSAPFQVVELVYHGERWAMPMGGTQNDPNTGLRASEFDNGHSALSLRYGPEFDEGMLHLYSEKDRYYIAPETRLRYRSPFAYASDSLGHVRQHELRHFTLLDPESEPTHGVSHLDTYLIDKSFFPKKAIEFIHNNTILHQGRIHHRYPSSYEMGYRLTKTGVDNLVMRAVMVHVDKFSSAAQADMEAKTTVYAKCAELAEFVERARDVWFNNPDEPLIMMSAFLLCPHTQAVLADNPHFIAQREAYLTQAKEANLHP